MDLLCLTRGHSCTSDLPIWNDGHWFSRCERCGCDMVRRGGGSWHTPPKGYKVVWKPRLSGEIDWNRLIAMQPSPAAWPAAAPAAASVNMARRVADKILASISSGGRPRVAPWSRHRRMPLHHASHGHEQVPAHLLQMRGRI